MSGAKISMRWGAVLAVACACAVVLITTLPGGVAAQRGRAELNDGNRLYEEGRFPEAHEKYLEALRDAPDLPLALFNDGNALYQSAEYVRALDAYRRAIESGDPARRLGLPGVGHDYQKSPFSSPEASGIIAFNWLSFSDRLKIGAMA